MNGITAYRLGWSRCKFHDDSVAGHEESRTRFIKKHGEAFVSSWENGWLDSASREVGR